MNPLLKEMFIYHSLVVHNCVNFAPFSCLYTIWPVKKQIAGRCYHHTAIASNLYTCLFYHIPPWTTLNRTLNRKDMEALYSVNLDNKIIFERVAGCQTAVKSNSPYLLNIKFYTCKRNIQKEKEMIMVYHYEGSWCSLSTYWQFRTSHCPFQSHWQLYDLEL